MDFLISHERLKLKLNISTKNNAIEPKNEQFKTRITITFKE